MKKTFLTIMILFYYNVHSQENEIRNLDEKIEKSNTLTIKILDSLMHKIASLENQLRQDQKNASFENIRSAYYNILDKSQLEDSKKAQIKDKINSEINNKVGSKSITEITNKLNQIIEKFITLEQKDKIGTFIMLKNYPNINQVELEIKDGVIFDVTAYKEDGIFYTNKRATNLSLFNKKRKSILLYHNNEEDTISLHNLIDFKFENGKKFIIEKAHVSLKRNENESQAIDIKNSLKSFVDFRIYSDFLGLIDESSNGLISFEGNSTFYLHPFAIGRFTYLLKKMRTHVRYSRLEDEDRLFNLNDENYTDLLQKSFLNVSGEIDVFEMRFAKHFPYKLIFKGRGSLDLTETTEEGNNDNSDKTTTLGFGIGSEIQIERFHNFGINMSFFLNRYQNNNLQENEILNFNTLSISSEAYFYLTNQQNDAIFLRFGYEQGRYKTNNRSNFFNLQVGYKAELNFNIKKQQ